MTAVLIIAGGAVLVAVGLLLALALHFHDVATEARAISAVHEHHADKLRAVCEGLIADVRTAQAQTVDAQTAARCWMEIARRHGHHVPESTA